MSELRARFMELADSLEPFIVVRYDKDGSGYGRQIDILEAFAKAEQIKGMEHIKHVLQTHHARVWLAEQIDAEIQKLKEGG